MIEFRKRGQNSRKQLLAIANKVIANPEFSDYEVSKRLDWINQAQNGCDYFWIEFNDFLRFFRCVVISEMKPNWFDGRWKVTWEHSSNISRTKRMLQQLENCFP